MRACSPGPAAGSRALAEALASVESVAIPPRERVSLSIDVLSSALEEVTAAPTKQVGTVRIGGVEPKEPPLRDALEGAYREMATLTEDKIARIDLVDQANAVRRWTTT